MTTDGKFRRQLVVQVQPKTTLAEIERLFAADRGCLQETTRTARARGVRPVGQPVLEHAKITHRGLSSSTVQLVYGHGVNYKKGRTSDE
jgi:hypothetical protein